MSLKKVSAVWEVKPSTECVATYGHTSTTLVVKNALQEPALKKSKRERFCQDDENRYIKFYRISVHDSMCMGIAINVHMQVSRQVYRLFQAFLIFLTFNSVLLEMTH